VKKTNDDSADEGGNYEENQAFVLQVALLRRNKKATEEELEQHARGQNMRGIGAGEMAEEREVCQGAEGHSEDQRQHHHQAYKGGNDAEKGKNETKNSTDECNDPLNTSMNPRRQEHGECKEKNGKDQQSFEQL